MKNKSILFFKKGDIRMNMLSYYSRYDIIIMEDEHGMPWVVKNIFSGTIYTKKLTDDLFLEYCKWKYKKNEI